MDKYVGNFQILSHDHATFETRNAYLSSDFLSYQNVIIKLLLIFFGYIAVILICNFIFNLNVSFGGWQFIGLIVLLFLFGHILFNSKMQEIVQVHLYFDQQQCLKVVIGDYKSQIKSADFAKMQIYQNSCHQRRKILPKQNMNILICNTNIHENLCLASIDCTYMVMTSNSLNEIINDYQPILNWMNLTLRNEVDLSAYKRI